MRCFVDRLMQHRAVDPDDLLDVVLDLSRIGVVKLGVVRLEMAVRHREVVTGASLVDVLRRERRGERQERRDEQQSRDARWPNHRSIIRGRSGGVNWGPVTQWSATGQ
jgi:hypothetical protein